jgi:aldose sugar dehydrogenase
MQMRGCVTCVFCFFAILIAGRAQNPTMLVPNLQVRTVTSGLVTPITMAFLGPHDFLILEKDTGQVKRYTNGAFAGVVLDLAVNAASERGLLGIALHPNFPLNPGIYLFWSCRTALPPTNSLRPDVERCAVQPEFGADSTEVLEVPLLGNRVDRFTWNGSALSFDRNLIILRSFQNDPTPNPTNPSEVQPPRGNHDGGVIAFGPDGKLYIIFGDVGRRGQLQNLPSGPTPTGLGSTIPDDQFGGPGPDDAHFSGVIIRLNADGSTPADNPFFGAGAAIGGQAGQNIQKIFCYGIRNSFGMAFDPLSGNLWFQENGEDAFDEISRAVPGMNSGWIQIAGPVSRVAQFRQIETTSLHHEDFPNLQQFRWGPENIASTPPEALSRLFMLPGAVYKDPEFSWKYVLAPAAIGFVSSGALGQQFLGDLIVGVSVPEPLGGPLFRFQITGNRAKIGVDDPRLEDRVADNLEPHEITESESLLLGRDFGVVTDIRTGPNGNLFVVSLSNGAVYEISARK